MDLGGQEPAQVDQQGDGVHLWVKKEKNGGLEPHFGSGIRGRVVRTLMWVEGVVKNDS